MEASRAMAAAVDVLGAARGEFENLGLSGNEARVLLALLQAGTATAVDLSRRSHVPRTSLYPVMTSLCERGLAQSVVSIGPVVWTSPGWRAVLERLQESHEDELRQHRARIENLRETLSAALPDVPVTTSYAHVLNNVYDLIRLYARLLGEARTEVLVFNQGPYVGEFRPNPAVMEMLARGVPTRALFIAAEIDGTAGEGLRVLAQTYAAAGVLTGVVGSLPMSLAVFDRQQVLLSLEDPQVGIPGYPTPLHIDHAGFAAAQADLFHHYWESAVPLRGRPNAVYDIPFPDVPPKDGDNVLEAGE